MVTQKNFKCINCGLCCHGIVVLEPKDISRIKELGHKEEEFVADHKFSPEKKILKREKGQCIFLRYDEKGKSSCTIHSHRPNVCRTYPFAETPDIKDCRPSLLLEKSFNESRELLNKRGFI